MSKLQAPFRVDHVGSFLRPKELVEAKEKFVKGEITREELTAVEDKAIEKLVEQQKKAGLKGFTDGEFRRQYWHLDFFWGLNGVELKQKSDINSTMKLQNLTQQMSLEKSLVKITHS